MITFLKRISQGLSSPGGACAKGKAGCRAYAIGDVHGRLDLLDELIGRIERDIASRPISKTYLVFLGDLVDRGPDSAGVVERLRNLTPEYATPIILGGNHEEIFLRVLSGDPGVLQSWLKFGGSECALSYGVDPEILKGMNEEQAGELLRRHVPVSHRDFLAGFADTFRFGDYLFVHAGIRPGIPLDQQDQKDLRWIRDPFLSDGKEHGFMVVHGHTIVSAIEERRNRIALDTGAYRTGILTAMGVEDGERWFLATGEPLEVSPGDAPPERLAI